MQEFFGRKIVLGLFIVLLYPLTAFTADSAQYQYQETRDLVAFVNLAAEAVEQNGESVFADFRKEGGPWYNGERYIFIWDQQGNRYVYPPDSEHERANMLDLKDAGGKPIGKMIVAAANNESGRGWVHYQWNRPHEIDPQWKTTYIVRAVAPSGKVYLVGSGIYQSRVEKAFIIEEVETAAAMLQKHGKKAFVTLRDPKSRFYFHDTYIFVTSDAGIELVKPAFPALEGRSLWDIRDINGKYLVREYTALALKNGSGWISYFWPKPDAPQNPVKKTTYVKKVLADEEVMIVGAGLYE